MHQLIVIMLFFYHLYFLTLSFSNATAILSRLSLMSQRHSRTFSSWLKLRFCVFIVSSSDSSSESLCGTTRKSGAPICRVANRHRVCRSSLIHRPLMPALPAHRHSCQIALLIQKIEVSSLSLDPQLSNNFCCLFHCY